MIASLKEFEALLKQAGTDFVAGSNFTVADLQYFF